MAEKFTVYAFQLRPDDFTRFAGGFDEDEPESYSEEEYSDVFSFVEKQNPSDMAGDVEMPEEDEGIFSIAEEDDNIFNLETEL